MNLDLVPLGWVHSLACLVALGTGAFVFATAKGTRRHRQLGQIFVASQIILNLTALGIYQLGTFFFPHVLAIITLVLIAAGWGSARLIRRHVVWKHVHLSSMILSYYLLIGGGVNEVFLRIDAMRDLVSREGGQLINMTHGVVMLVFLILLVGWNAAEIVRTLLRRRRSTLSAA
ncbi:MAG: hypothetical protein Q8S03_07575 [Brevundimonas sp.]|uniref:hypothetical protein n=1 Tax=Brevundimonas sp. TaxID=1871086 RepID=UPI0027364E78|nr:hypothetical protein [Brevundimonas sp.]MDP3404532.1 hypothetical protein [Brevundimonas sp.]